MKRPCCTLSKFTSDELISIYQTLNSWEWDRRLGPMPKEFDNNAYSTISPIMHGIESVLGNRAIMRSCHPDMTDEEFEKWWNSFDMRPLTDDIGLNREVRNQFALSGLRVVAVIAWMVNALLVAAIFIAVL